MQRYPYYIAGNFKEGKDTIDIINPSTEEVFAKIFNASGEDLNLSLKEAKKAQKEWKNTSYQERAKVLKEIEKVILDNLSSLAELESKEIGKPHKESLFIDIPLAAECFSYYASFLSSWEETYIKAGEAEDIITYSPYGVVGIYLPYNTPLMIFGFTAAAALAAGNSLIVKPSEYGSLSMLELAKHFDKIDMPKGLINIISGEGEKSGKFLAGAEIDMLSFTGSRETLRKITQASVSYPKKIICELGGCNLGVVFSDANLNYALGNLLAASFLKSGQICIGSSLILVEEDIYEEFKHQFLKKVSSLKIGDAFEPTVDIGPLPTQKHLQKVKDKVNEITSRGGKIIFQSSDLPKKGYFYPPTVIEIEKVLYEELFSPVVLLMPFKREDIESIILNNPTGLVLQLWTENLNYAKKIGYNCGYGTVWINTFVQMSPQTPFGGTKKSGWGRNLGKSGFLEYVHSQHLGSGDGQTPLNNWFGE